MKNDIKALNDVTQTMIDSYKGYEKCLEIADDSSALTNSFRERATRRSQLINDFQAEVRSLGGEPETDGSALGAAHRGWANVTSAFQDDRKAAVEAIDDGEDFLAGKIENQLEDNDIRPRTRDLLQQAHSSAREGERFAEAMERSLDD